MQRLTIIVVVLAAVRGAAAQPAPNVVPQGWELRFRYVVPQRISVTLPTEKEPRTFWYLLYTVENDSGELVQFLPTFDLMTDTMKVYPSDIEVHPAVYEAIIGRHKKTHPFLTEPVRVVGRLLRGEDHARDSIAVWPDFDAKASRFTVYVAGLSGETKRLRNPRFDPAKPEMVAEKLPDGSTIDKVVNPKYFTLRKTLVLDYVLPGSEGTRARAKPQPQPHTWTLR